MAVSLALSPKLSNFLIDVAKAGYVKMKKQVKTIVETVARDKGVLKARRVSDGWWRRILERQHILSLRKGDATANVRVDCINPEAIGSHFDLLKEVLQVHNLMESPGQIYNVDETGMPFNRSPPKVIIKRGHKKVRYRTAGNKSQITVIGCVSAVGHAISAFVIFDVKGLNVE